MEIKTHCAVHQELIGRSTSLEKQSSKTKKKRSDLWLPEAAGRRGDWMKGVKRDKLAVIR